MAAPVTRLIIFILLPLISASCSVISREVRKEAGPLVPFKSLADNWEGYLGKTVILGGYILETRELSGKTVITVLQTPLSGLHEPGSRARSLGRFTVVHDGILDSREYYKDRKITVAGTVVRPRGELPESCPLPCPSLKERELFLWQDYRYLDYYDVYYDDDHIFNRRHSHRFYRHRFYHHPHHPPSNRPPAHRPHIH